MKSILNNRTLKTYVFYCSNSIEPDQLADALGGLDTVTVKAISLPCSGKIDIPYLVKAFETGADGAVIVTCKQNECQHLEGNLRAQKRAEAVESLLEEIGMGRGRMAVIMLKEEGVEGAVSEIKDFFGRLRNLPQPASPAKRGEPGQSGDYLGSGLDGLTINVHGNAQDQLGQIIKKGKLVIHGDVGQTFLYSAKGGSVFVLGNAAGRPLINSVGKPRVVINGTCLDFLAESFMAGDPFNGGGFAITSVDDLLNVQEFITVKQEVTSISVKFDDIAVADFFETQVDLGRKPEQFARIWLHTHPGDSPEPSGQDETTFCRVFGKCNWALMFILAENNKTYAKLSFNVGPKGDILIPVEVDYSQAFGPSDHKLWDEEYQANVSQIAWLSDFDLFTGETTGLKDIPASGWSYDFIGELEKLDPIERQMVLDELANRPDLWNDGEVVFI